MLGRTVMASLVAELELENVPSNPYFTDGQTESSKRSGLSRFAYQGRSRARVLPGLQCPYCVGNGTSMPTAGFLEPCCPLSCARLYFPFSRLENGGVPLPSCPILSSAHRHLNEKILVSQFTSMMRCLPVCFELL